VKWIELARNGISSWPCSDKGWSLLIGLNFKKTV